MHDAEASCFIAIDLLDPSSAALPSMQLNFPIAFVPQAPEGTASGPGSPPGTAAVAAAAAKAAASAKQAQAQAAAKLQLQQQQAAAAKLGLPAEESADSNGHRHVGFAGLTDSSSEQVCLAAAGHCMDA